MIVTFCGHREIYHQERITDWLNVILGRLVSEGASVFYLGGYGAFDRLAASAVRNLKLAHPELELVLVLPYLNSGIQTDDYDSTIYPALESVPPRFAILKRNQWMVDQSDLVIAFTEHSWGGAAQTLQYAQRKAKHVIQFPNLT